MPHHVAVAALVLCVISGTVSASDPVAQMAGMASKDAFASHEHSPAFLGFMSKHDKKYCDGIVACEVSILREKIFNLNQEFVNVHNSNPGACPGMREPRSIEAGRVNTPELKTRSICLPLPHRTVTLKTKLTLLLPSNTHT